MCNSCGPVTGSLTAVMAAGRKKVVRLTKCRVATETEEIEQRPVTRTARFVATEQVGILNSNQDLGLHLEQSSRNFGARATISDLPLVV